METELALQVKTLLERVAPPDRKAMADAQTWQDRLVKPPGSLGRLESLSVQLAGITGQVRNRFTKPHILVFAADNGVVEEGVACAPQSVTLSQTVNLAHARTGASVLARHFGCGLTVCDVGVNGDVHDPAVLARKIAYGTKNLAKGPAMTRGQALTAILTGAALAQETDADLFGIGEMGIGNTTTSAAVLCALLGEDPERLCGRGGGLSDEGLRKKRDVVRQALALHRPDAADPVDVLSKVGGFDLAAMCGAFLGAAASSKPVVIDGLISVTAALCAVRLCPNVRAYLIPSHASAEPGYRAAVDALDLRPMLLLDMRLGEGSGCPLAFQVIDAACAIINEMPTFAEAGIHDGYLDELRDDPTAWES